MKRLIFLLMMLPVMAQAQNFEFGVNGGLSLHARPAGNRFTWQEDPKASYYLSARANLKLPRYRFGVGVEMVNIRQVNTLLYNYTYEVENNIAKPLVVPHAFLNRTFDMSNGYAYVGAMLGAAIAKTGVNVLQYSSPNVVSGYTTEYFSVTGLTGGLQAGWMFNIVKNLGLNTEAAVRLTSFKYEPPTPAPDNRYRYRVFYFPFSVGLRYGI